VKAFYYKASKEKTIPIAYNAIASIAGKKEYNLF
jgi:hypothetical protein